MSRTSSKQPDLWVVVEDGWIMGKMFPLDQLEECKAHVDYCRKNYVGRFDYHRCSDDYPRRFCKAVGI